MRIRTIKPEFFKHDELAELPALTRLLFVGLWCMADSAGRLADKPKRIKAEILPYDEWDAERSLQSLHDGGFICRYEAESQRLIEVCGFKDHQRLTTKEAAYPSKHPAPPSGEGCEIQGQRSDSIDQGTDPGDERDQPTDYATQARQSGEGHNGDAPGSDPEIRGGTSGTTGKETERKGKERSRAPACGEPGSDLGHSLDAGRPDTSDALALIRRFAPYQTDTLLKRQYTNPALTVAEDLLLEWKQHPGITTEDILRVRGIAARSTFEGWRAASLDPKQLLRVHAKVLQSEATRDGNGTDPVPKRDQPNPTAAEALAAQDAEYAQARRRP
jgi:hypothetical protein